MGERGKDMGLKFGSWLTWPNTFNAHRLCYFLEELDTKNNLSNKDSIRRGLDLVNKYYELTYERGENISTPEGAAKALEELGFADKMAAVQWLKQGGGEQEVREADTYAKQNMDIHGVPFFVVSQDGGNVKP